MAHMAKFKSAQCPNMLHHYRRDREATLERSNVDRERTHLNYTLGPDGGLERIRERVSEVEATMTRSVRSDAIVMCDWVVTAPPDLRAEDQREFFESCYDFVRGRYGDENMLGGYVHMDETTPHIHIALTPVVERDGDRLAMSAKEMFTRQELMRFHGELSDRVAHDLGYRPQIETTGERTLERALSRAGSLEEYQRAKDRLERLRHDERELGARNRELGARAEQLREQLRDAQGRQRQVEEAYRQRQETAEEVRGEVEHAEREHRSLEAEDRRLEREHSRLEGVRDRLAQRVRELRERVERALDRLRSRVVERPDKVKELVRDFERAEGLRERKDELQRLTREAVDRCGPSNRPRLDEISRALDTGYQNYGHSLNALVEFAERDVERTEKKLQKLREHPLRNRRDIADEKGRLERYVERRDELRDERDRLVAERDRLRAEERKRDVRVEEAREPYRSELERVTSEHGELVEELRARHRALSGGDRKRLERAMDGRNSRDYASERRAYEAIERERSAEESRGRADYGREDRTIERDWGGSRGR